MAGPVKITDRIDTIISWLVEFKNIIQKAEEIQSTLLTAMGELVALNDAKVDEVLTRHTIVLHKDGKQIFPRPRYPVVVDFGKPTN